MTDLQNKPIVIGTPIEIDKACNDMRLRLASLPWLDRPYLIAKRFYKKDPNSGKSFYFPETYAPAPNTGKLSYQRLTPDSKSKGTCFFMVGTGVPDYNHNEYNFIKYPVGIIFSVNLKLIDKVKLESGLFTRELMRDVRRLITTSKHYVDFNYEILRETDDLRETFREFILDDLEAYNRAPMQCFRFDLNFIIEELC